MKVRGLAVLVAVLALLGASCGSDDGGGGSDASSDSSTTVSTPESEDSGWAEIVAAAEEEGVVYFAGSSGSDWVDLKAAFEAAYPGIRLEPSTVTTGQVIGRLDQERELAAGGTTVEATDVILHTSPVWFQEADTSGNLLELEETSEVAELWAGIEEYEVSSSYKILNYATFANAWNTTLFDGTIESVEDALDPSLKGQIGSIDAHAAPVDGAQYALWDEQVDDFMSRFVAQEPKLVASASAGAQDLVAGEYAVGVQMIPANLIPLIEEGAPIEYIVPSDSLIFPYAAGIVKWAENPNAAQVFMNWLMTEGGQQVLTDSIKGTTALPGIEIQLPGIDQSGDLGNFTVFDQTEFTTDDYNAFLAEWDAALDG